jgi:putative ABC transport system permease protein
VRLARVSSSSLDDLFIIDFDLTIYNKESEENFRMSVDAQEVSKYRMYLMGSLLQDLRIGARMLFRKPGFTLAIVLTLALGIGANTAIFSVTDKLLFRSLPVKEPQQLVLIKSVSVYPHFVSDLFSYPNYSDYRTQNQVLSGLAGFDTTYLELKTGDRVERIASEYVSANYFDLLGIGAARGRAFSHEEDKAPGTQPVAVVSDAFWRNRFGADPNLIGRTLTLNGIPLMVIGIAPPNFNGMILEKPAEIWVPALMYPQLERSQIIDNREEGFLELIGRVKSDISLAQAESELDALAQRTKEAHTPAGRITKGMPFSEQHLKFEPGGRGHSLLRNRFSTPLKLLTAVAALVLLIACANVAGLLLARGVARRKEMAIRLAIGASGWRVVRQLLSESLLLAVTGGAAGLLIAPWLVTFLVKTQARFDNIETLLSQGIDLRMLSFTALATLFAGIVFGIFPAWQGSKADLVPALKEDAAGILDRCERRHGLRGILVIAQIAVATVTLVGAGLCVKSLRNLLALDPGYQTENLMIAPLELDEKKYGEARGRAMQQQVVERLAALPGVEAVSYGAVSPLSGRRFMGSMMVEGRQPLPNEEMAFDADIVGPGYHEAMGIKLVEGRGFTEGDRAGAPGVVIINVTLAQRFFPGERALGKRLRSGPGQPLLEIVGITRDIKHHDLTENPIPHFDLPALQWRYSTFVNVIVRVDGRAASLIPRVRSDLLALDASLPVDKITTMSGQVGRVMSGMRLASTLVGVFGLVALLLASIGLYGVMAWTVSRRTREIGIRLALGAQQREISRLVIGQGIRLVLIGLVIGLASALGLTRLITSLLFGVGAGDPLTFVSIALLLMVVALVACWIPARRAAKVDPMIALRYE